MPTKQCPWSDQPGGPSQRSRQLERCSCEQRTISRTQLRPRDLTAQHLELVPQHDHLHVPQAQAAATTNERAQQSPKREIDKGENHAADPPRPPRAARHDYWHPSGTAVSSLRQRLWPQWRWLITRSPTAVPSISERVGSRCCTRARRRCSAVRPSVSLRTKEQPGRAVGHAWLIARVDLKRAAPASLGHGQLPLHRRSGATGPTPPAPDPRHIPPRANADERVGVVESASARDTRAAGSALPMHPGPGPAKRCARSAPVVHRWIAH